MGATQLQALKDLREKVEAGGYPSQSEWFQVFPDLSSDDDFPRSMMAAGAAVGKLDAAKALHEAVLPGWKWSIVPSGGGHRIGVWPSTELSSSSSAANKCPARAWLLAILSALIAMEGEQ